MDERQNRVDHFNAGAAGSDRETSYETDQRARARSMFGSKDIERVFPGQTPKAIVPWPAGGRSKTEPKYDKAAVTAELIRQPRTVDIDPRVLSAGQPHVVRAGVEHYLGDTFERTGQTFADQGNVGNQFPFVVTKHGDTDNPEHLIISGHHRATAALLQGKKLTTRWIEQE